MEMKVMEGKEMKGRSIMKMKGHERTDNKQKLWTQKGGTLSLLYCLYPFMIHFFGLLWDPLPNWFEVWFE